MSITCPGRTFPSGNRPPSPATGRIMICSGCAASLLPSTKKCSASGGPCAPFALTRAIDRLTGNRFAGPETLVLFNEDRRRVVKVSTIGSNLDDTPRLFSPQPQMLVLFRDVMQADRVDPSFARTFHLTSAEMKLCDGLLSGLSLAEIAASRSIAIGTARHRLKTIFVKTGTNRQVELVRLMSAFG